jgi:hypothetical protein
MMNIYGRGGNNDDDNNNNNIMNMGPPPPPPGGERKYHNPCRFAGHDHEWKDCPNNYRNKKKNMMMGNNMNNPHHHNNYQQHQDHYGPASSSYEAGGNSNVGEHHHTGRPSIVGSRSQSSDFYGSVGGGGGDRGYPNNNNNDRQLGSRSQSFGDNLRINTGGLGDGNNSGGPGMGGGPKSHYSPSPRGSFTSGGVVGGDRRRSNNNIFSPHGGGGGGPPDSRGDNSRPSPMSSSSRGYSASSYTPSSSSYRKGGRSHFGEDVINDVPMPPIASPGERGGIGTGGGGGDNMMWSSSSPAAKSPGEIMTTPHHSRSLSEGGVGGRESFRGSGGRHYQTPHQQHRGSFSKSPGEIRPSPYNKSPGEIRSDVRHEGNDGQQQHRGSFTSSQSPGEIRPSPYAKSPGEIHHDVRNESYQYRGGRASLDSPRNSFVARQDSFGSSPRHSREIVPSSPRYHQGQFYNKSSYSREEGEEVDPSSAAAAKPDEGPVQPALKDPPSPVKEEKKKAEVLTCSALKDEEKIRKAEDIICRMAKVMDNLSPSVPSDEGLTPLPTKIEITKCMAALEKKIKAKGQEAAATKKKVREMEEQEKEERMRKEMEKVKEEERKAQEELDKRRSIEKEFEDRIDRRNQTVKDKRDELMQVFNARKHELSQKRLSERTKIENECRAAVEEKTGGLKMEISTIRQKVKEAERTIQELDELAFQEASLATIPDIIDEDGSDALPTMDAPGKMSSLISKILAQNQRTASEAHHDSLTAIPFFPEGGKEDETNASYKEWSNRARRVTGIHDALYLEPKDLPMFEENNRTFLELAPRMKEIIRAKNNKLKSRWEDLANQYVTRQAIYKEETGVDLESSGGYFSAAKPIEIEEPAPRGNNPYRRPRRGISPGDVVRSEYEQEQIIAEIAAKEAMEKRIKEGGCALPRQRGLLERELFASYSNSFFGLRVDDMLADEEERRHINIWTDMEKCIFLDRFLHHPKDFRKIATFLRNKTTKDCIKFYYDSKKTVPYKHALKEFLLRKKRRGDIVPWDGTIQAVLAVGATVRAGNSAEKPLEISIPDNDFTYRTKSFHPMKLEVFNNLEESVLNAKHTDEAKKEHKSKRSNWFILDSASRKHLKHHDKEHHHQKRKQLPAGLSDDDQEPKKIQRKNDMTSVHEEPGKPEKRKHKPQKWKAEEKRLLYEALEKYGHDWNAISRTVGTRTDVQAKNYFHDNKEKITKQLNERANKGKDGEGVKVKKKPGRKKKVKDPPPPDAVADVASSAQGDTGTTNSSTSVTSEQEEQYRQQMILQQQQDHIRQQIHLQQQQQHIQRLVQQQQQEEMYRQHQEELYRQQVHQLRQQEMLQAHAQQFQQHQNHYHDQRGQQNYDQHQLQNLQQMLAMRGRQSPYYQGGNGGGGDLERIFQAAAAAGIPQSALEAALSNASGQQQQGQQQALNMELLQRIIQQQQQQQQQQQGDNSQYYGHGHGYGNEYQR